MVIDMHVHPALFSDICGDKDRLKLRCDEMGYHLMGPSPLDVLINKMHMRELIKWFSYPWTILSAAAKW